MSRLSREQGIVYRLSMGPDYLKRRNPAKIDHTYHSWAHYIRLSRPWSFLRTYREHARHGVLR